MDKILIGIMSHNYARYINEAVQSALAQTIHCDVLVTDDGSTDNTEAELLKYGDKIMWIVHHDNSGDELRAIEDIIAYSTPYDYIFIMSADDCLYHDSIQRLVDKAKDTGSDWTYGGLDVIDEHGTLLSRWTYDGFPESVQEAVQYMLDNKALGTTLGSLFSGRFLNGKKPSRFPHTNFSLDASTAIDWYTYNPIIRRLRGQVLKYRRHSESRTSKCNQERRIMQKDLTEKIERVFKHSLRRWMRSRLCTCCFGMERMSH